MVTKLKQPATRPQSGANSRRGVRPEKRVLALASGGMAGLLYQVGALEAFDDAALGIRSTDFDMYLGVGSGAAVAALLANGVRPREMALAFEGQSRRLPQFEMDRLLKPNYGEFLKKGLTLPASIYRAIQENLVTPSELSLQDMLLSLTGALPSGLFVTHYIESYLHEALRTHGRTDNFDELSKDLFVVATDVDTGSSSTFCRGRGDGVPISRAVAATAATPMLFAPVKIGSKRFVDGTMTKTLHLSLALKREATVIVAISPLRPLSGDEGIMQGRPTIVESGVASVAKQALRTLLHNRLEVGLAQYADRLDAVDTVLIEPGPQDDMALWYNVRKARTRAFLKEAGYTRASGDLPHHREVLERHGIIVSSLTPTASARPQRKLMVTLDRLETRVKRSVRRRSGVAALRRAASTGAS